MKRILSNRIFISVLCLLIAGVIAFMVIPSMYTEKATTTQILTANTEIKKGTQITDVMLSTVEVGAYGLPSGLITDKTVIVGKYADADISKGDYLMEQKFKDYLFDETLDNIIKDGQRLVNVNYINRRIVRAIELEGAVTSDITSMFDRLKTELNLPDGAYTVTNVSYFDYGTKKIQLRQNFTVTVTATYYIEIFNPIFAPTVKIPLNLKSTLTGMSEVYWKP